MTTTNFSYTGANQPFTVPAGITSIAVIVRGAGGGNNGGAGGQVTGTLAVSPGQVLNIFVGGAGAINSGATFGAGGFNGGGNGGSTAGTGALSGSGGGGATDIRIGGTALANRVCVAAGGGGAGAQAGGAGGGVTGSAGTAGGTSNGGVGGGAAAGGAAGTGSGGGAGTAGTSGTGGLGGTVSGTNARGGGGGGGGLFGGGGGYSGIGAGLGGGGGGGSSSVGSLTGSANTGGGGAAAQTNGSVTLVYDQAPNTPALQTPTNASAVDDTLANITFSWLFSDPDSGDTQSAADFRYRAVGAGSWNTTVNAVTTATSYTVTMASLSLVTGTQYEWQVQTYDPSSVASGWSSSFTFTAVVPPAAPVITAPTAIVSGNPQTVTWATGLSQITYQIRTVADNAGAPNTGTIYTDTGAVSSSALTGTVGVLFVTPMHVQVRYQHDAGVWSPWADSGALTLNLAAPATPTVVVTPNPAAASVSVAITNPSGASNNDVYRTDLSLGNIKLQQDWLADGVIGANLDTGQVLTQSVTTPPKMLNGGISPNAAAGNVNSWVSAQALGTQKIKWAACDFLFQTTGSTDNGSVTLMAAVPGYSDASQTPDMHMQLIITKTTWTFNVISGGVTTTVLTGSFAVALSYNTEYHTEMYQDQANRVSVVLPDDSLVYPINTLVTAISGNVLVAKVAMANAATDHAPVIRRIYADTIAPAEYRIASGVAINSTYIDYTPASGVLYRYRVVAKGAFGGFTSST